MVVMRRFRIWAPFSFSQTANAVPLWGIPPMVTDVKSDVDPRPNGTLDSGLAQSVQPFDGNRPDRPWCDAPDGRFESGWTGRAGRRAGAAASAPIAQAMFAAYLAGSASKAGPQPAQQNQ